MKTDFHSGKWTIDYYSFGMQMPGRTFTSSTYRYGFNGKEKDDEVHGSSGTSYDYGFRIYDPRLGRFLSVDPITRKFPSLTPYQYASNRPIDGIDLDGLEYVSYKVITRKDGTKEITMTKDFTLMSDAEIQQVHKMSATDFYKKNSKSYGELGKGVLFEYFEESESGELVQKPSKFMSAQKNPISKGTRHGIYYGAGGPTKFGGEHDPISNPYKYDIPPIDEVDALARTHDIAYDFPGYQDGGYRNDPKTLPADYEFVQGLKDYLDRAGKEGYIDPITGKAPSEEAISAAKNAITIFEQILIPHKEKIKERQEKKAKASTD